MARVENNDTGCVIVCAGNAPLGLSVMDRANPRMNPGVIDIPSLRDEDTWTRKFVCFDAGLL